MKNEPSSKHKTSVVTIILVLLAVIGYFVFSTSQDQSFSTHNIDENKTALAVENKLTSKSKLPSSKKKVIPSVSPLIIGQSNKSFSGKMKDLVVSPDGQTLAVSTMLEGYLFHVYFVNAVDNTIIHKVAFESYLYAMTFVGDDKLVLREATENSENKITVYDIQAQEIIHTFNAPAAYGGPLVTSADGRLFVGANYDIYRLEEDNLSASDISRIVQNVADNNFENIKKIFNPETSWQKEYKNFLSKISGETIESYDDVIKHTEKLSQAAQNLVDNNFVGLNEIDNTNNLQKMARYQYLARKLADNNFAPFKRAFTPVNSRKMESYKKYLSESTGETIESYDDVIKHAAKIKADFHNRADKEDTNSLAESFRYMGMDNDILIFDVNNGKFVDVIENVCRSGFKVDGLLLNNSKNELVILDRPTEDYGNMPASGDNYQAITRYDLNSFKAIQTLKNKSEQLITDDYIKWGSESALIGVCSVDFKKSTVVRSHLRSFDVDYFTGKLYRIYKGAEVRHGGRVFMVGGEEPEQGIVCENVDSGEELFRVKLELVFDHIRVNPSTNELLLWKKGDSTYKRFDLATKKLKEDSYTGFMSIPYQLFFKGDNELIIEESNNFHSYDLTSGTNLGKFYFDKDMSGNSTKSFLIANEKNLLTGGLRDGKAYILDLENGKKVRSIGDGYTDGGFASDYGLETLHVNKKADLTALKLSYRNELAVHKISSGEKIFSLESDDWKIGGRQNVYVQFNDSGSLMYLGDNGYGSKSAPNSGIYDLDSGTKNTFTLKNGKEVSIIYDMVVNEKANLIFVRTVDGKAHYAGVWDATTGKCIKEIDSLVDRNAMFRRRSAKTLVEGISDDGKYLLTVNGAYDINNDSFVWNWQNTSDGLKPSGVITFDEDQSTIVNLSDELITVKDLMSGETLKQFRLVLPEDESPSITGGIWSSATNKLVLTLKEPEVWILSLE